MNKDTDGGLQPGRDPDDIDAAQSALNRMRDAAASRGEIRRKAPPRPGTTPPKSGRSTGSTRGFGQFHGTGRDPMGLGKVVGRLVAERGWSSPVAVGSVMAEWATLVGPEISAHCTPESFTDTTLHVRCDSTAWATQLRLLSLSLLEKFRTELGEGVVTKIQVLDLRRPAGARAAGPSTGAGRGTPTDNVRDSHRTRSEALLAKLLKIPQTACRALRGTGAV